MNAQCHRCHGELPAAPAGDALTPEAQLFCPHCSAPQIRFPEHMQTAAPAAGEVPTTGALPPPRPQQVEWRSALRAAGAVAVVGAALEVAGLKVPVLSFVGTIWVVGGAVIALGIYKGRRPDAWMDARIGLRIGLATGLGLVATMALGLAIAGLVARFWTHGMGSFDSAMTQQFALFEAQLLAQMRQQTQDKDIQQKLVGLLRSPEMRGAAALFNLAVTGGLVMLFSAGGGAFAGMLRGSRWPRPDAAAR